MDYIIILLIYLKHAAEFTYSIVTPEIPGGRRRMQHRIVAIRKPNNAPANVREGLSRAMQVVTEVNGRELEMI